MSFSDLFTSGFKQRNRDHFAAIVRVALSDGIVTDEEKAFLNRTAINLEIDDAGLTEISLDPEDLEAISTSAAEQTRDVLRQFLTN